MNKNVYLNEEKYQKIEKRLSLAALLILIIGLCVGGYFLYKGIAKPNSSKVEALQKQLDEKRKKLEDKGVVYTAFTKYTDGEAYDLKIITEVLDPQFDNCSFNEYKNNNITKEYCSQKNSISEFSSFSFIIAGVCICATSCGIAFVLFMIAKGRKVAAFTAQQMMPVAKEGMNEMAPSIGNVAKEITKGVKEGMKDDEE